MFSAELLIGGGFRLDPFPHSFLVSDRLYMEELFEAGVGEEDPFDDYRNILYTRHIEKLTDEEKLKGNKTILNIVNH